METKVCSTPDELVGAIRMGQASGKTKVSATKGLIQFFLNNEKLYYFAMMGSIVIEAGREKDFEQEKNITIEQVNFPK